MTKTPDGIDGVKAAIERIGSAETRTALRELLETAVRLKLDPRLASVGKETAFSFGRRRYPLCRINKHKGLAFHTTRHAKVLTVRSTTDHEFRLAAATLRRTALKTELGD